MTQLLEDTMPHVPAVVDRREAVPVAPTVETMLMAAIERGIDPAGMEKLAAIYEREMARRAEAAFSSAMMAFRAEVGPVLKNRDAFNPKTNRVMYRFADLEEITKVVDPVLYRHGLTYTFDSELLNGLTVVRCTVRHADGHKETSSFTCKASGTQLMNDAQASASAVTFGRRYSLVLALGLTIDNDDDGRRAAAPNPAPDHDPDAPKVGTRAERQNPVTVEELNTLLHAWRERSGKEDGSLGEFAAWAGGVLKVDAEGLKHPRGWTREQLNKCGEVML